MNIKSRITMAEKVQFVSHFMGLVVVNGNYTPAVKDYAFKLCALIFYTDYDYSSADENELETIMNDTIDKIVGAAEEDVTIVLNACEEEIELQKNREMIQFENSISKWGELPDAILEMVEKVSGVFTPEQMMELAKEIKPAEKTRRVKKAAPAKEV